MTLNKYAVAALQLAILMIAALQAALAEGLSIIEVWQLVALFVTNLGVYLVPLLTGVWAAGLKVAVAVVGAAVTAIIPLVNGYWNAEAFIIVLLAAASAFAAQFGVALRLTSVASVLAAPEVSSASVQATDPKAVQVVEEAPAHRSHAGV